MMHRACCQTFQNFLCFSSDTGKCGVQELMMDPVTAADGCTYERAEIERWFAKSDTSPMHGDKLDNKDLIPNVSIRQYIQKWKEQNRGKTLYMDG